MRGIWVRGVVAVVGWVVAAGLVRAAPDAADALAAVKTAVEQRFEGVDVTQVWATPIDGLYEVQVGMDIVYVDADANYVIQGSLIDVQAGRDLTNERMLALTAVPFESLPLDLAIRQVKGDGSRRMAVFEDPNCIYCKRLHASLRDIDDVTVYSFLMPILSPDSADKARNVWCAADPAAAWSAWMLEGREPAAAQCDDNPVEEVLALGRKLLVRGTPAIFFEDNTRVNGALPTEDLRTRLDALGGG